MVIKVLVVDDSHFFQQRLTSMINANPQLKVVGVASNGREAVEKAASLKPDVITMDYEMPLMDGVTAVRHIMRDNPTPILMFSSMTYEGAKITLDALDAGALDFLPKNFSEVSQSSELLQRKLNDRILAIARRHQRTAPKPTPAPAPSARPVAAPVSLKGRVKLLVLGASTGGPLAITEVMRQLPANFPVPVLLVLHMPENFTKAYADRLNNQCQLAVKEAQTGDPLKPGQALLAPGGQQLLIDPSGGRSVQVLPGDNRVNYRPSVDVTFASAAKVFGGAALGVVMTGMGADGREGARLIKRAGGAIWTQDEDSCVIYGMPQAVAREGLSDRVVSLGEMGGLLAREL